MGRGVEGGIKPRGCKGWRGTKSKREGGNKCIERAQERVMKVNKNLYPVFLDAHPISLYYCVSTAMQCRYFYGQKKSKVSLTEEWRQTERKRESK